MLSTIPVEGGGQTTASSSAVRASLMDGVSALAPPAAHNGHPSHPGLVSAQDTQEFELWVWDSQGRGAGGSPASILLGLGFPSGLDWAELLLGQCAGC